MATRNYNRNGITTRSARGTAVKKMCKAVKDSGTVKANGKLSIRSGYEHWLSTQARATDKPVTYARYHQIVKAFFKFYELGELGVFRLLDSDSISYDDAKNWGENMLELIGIAHKGGIKVKMSIV